MATEIFEIHLGSQISNSFMECAMRVWDRALPLQLPFFTNVFSVLISTSVQLTEVPGILPAASSWTSHLLIAMNGLHDAHGYQQRIQTANPLDLSQVVVDLRLQVTGYWKKTASSQNV
eukprot:1136149-Pelagomonas_calceolata.AAC.2